MASTNTLVRTKSPAPDVAPSDGVGTSRPPVVTTSAVRTFGTEEVIVSKTDLQGRITYVNNEFLRLSGYEERDVIGKPHNIIRHPDMPKVVFSLLWSEIQAGREIFAYMKNRAVDGAAYWVFAHMTPTFRDDKIVSYHSNRRSPAMSAVRAIEPIYADLLRIESRFEHPSEAIRASTEALNETLAKAAMTYDEFVWSLDASMPGARR